MIEKHVKLCPRSSVRARLPSVKTSFSIWNSYFDPSVKTCLTIWNVRIKSSYIAKERHKDGLHIIRLEYFQKPYRRVAMQKTHRSIDRKNSSKKKHHRCRLCTACSSGHSLNHARSSEASSASVWIRQLIKHVHETAQKSETADLDLAGQLHAYWSDCRFIDRPCVRTESIVTIIWTVSVSVT